MADNDDGIPGYRALADAVHAHGMQRLRPALPRRPRNHGEPRRFARRCPSHRRQCPTSGFTSCRAPCRSAHRRSHRWLRLRGPATQGSGTRRREIVASHGYLPAQFLNPRVNVRTDQLRRQRREPAAVPARGDRAVRARGRTRLRRRPSDIGGPKRPKRASRSRSRSTRCARSTPMARSTTSALSPERQRRSRVRPHRAADELPSCLHRTAGSTR